MLPAGCGEPAGPASAYENHQLTRMAWFRPTCWPDADSSAPSATAPAVAATIAQPAGRGMNGSRARTVGRMASADGARAAAARRRRAKSGPCTNLTARN
ncbi:hypothetical protein BURPS1710b_0490 [Burkholderia pseudomallei 1710b]|uniref:Uncharacterized protein n=1 Tax=Burkholderia pseudomallei (strain 1710b) TaxID=320372 RepID=Q3JWZ9_BURP1|nr:hypothetical protein BURPS1710b_0490 [Burkholderia pseudomallei 1710b]